MREVVVRNPEVIWREEESQRSAILKDQVRGVEVADRGWVILVHRGRMHQLNLLAGEIWMLADGSHDVAQMARVLADRYDAPLAEIQADVAAFVADCANAGWLEVRKA